MLGHPINKVFEGYFIYKIVNVYNYISIINICFSNIFFSSFKVSLFPEQKYKVTKNFTYRTS